jgi:hypothetical protein
MLRAVEDRLNRRPRKILGWRTPHDVFHAALGILITSALRRPLEFTLELERRQRAYGRTARRAGRWRRSTGECPRAERRYPNVQM